MQSIAYLKKQKSYRIPSFTETQSETALNICAPLKDQLTRLSSTIKKPISDLTYEM